MRHIGRVHRVSVQWLHERTGRHPNKDPTLLFYEDTANMSADIYTKGFNTLDTWGRALRLINVFRPEELSSKRLFAWVQERNELGRSESVYETREFIIAKNAQARDSAREKGKNIPTAAKAAPTASSYWCTCCSRCPRSCSST